MSGAMSPQLAQAASTIALRAEAAARGLTLGRRSQAKLIQSLDKHRAEKGAQSMAAIAWRDMPIRTRALLLAEAQVTKEDPREAARRPWDEWDEATRDRVGALARGLRRDLANASQLF